MHHPTLYYIWSLFVRAMLFPFVLPIRAIEAFIPAPGDVRKGK